MERRKLNEIEYLLLTFGQPNNISMCITIKGELDLEKLRNALDLAQEKHPMLKAQIYFEDEEQFLIWGDINSIPLDVIPRKKKELYREIIEQEFITPFDMGINYKNPLIRVKVLQSETVFDLIITIQHVIADGISMAFLFRDILEFYINPQKKFKPFEIVKETENILPSDIRKKIPKSKCRFKIVSWLIKIGVLFYRLIDKFRSESKEPNQLEFDNINDQTLKTYSWIFNKQQTMDFIKKCKEQRISVQSALCTMFLEDFPIINNPINLRDRLDYPVGQSVGLYASGLNIKKPYNPKISFWKNAEQYYHKLRKNLSSDKVFGIFKIISRVVPIESLIKFRPIFLELASRNNPFTITNLGALDRLNLLISSENLFVDHLYGGVSMSFEALVITVFTIKNKMHFHFHYFSPPHTEKEIKNYVENAIEKLNIALEN
ncbi:MAG: hypothetical protein EU531_08675 [Promethearchaeota archaeon]|nr:MAG: hypothetical protein EU531_08675 [Candidatus Lokiarchaeota archaeon]